MAPRSPPAPPPSEVRLALGYLLRVAHAHSLQREELQFLQGILVSLATGRRLTRRQAAAIREAEDELVRTQGADATFRDDDPRAIAVDAALRRRRSIRDRHADKALRTLVDVGQTFAKTYEARAFERQSIEVFDAIKDTYVRVRDGLTLDAQRAEIEVAFHAAGLKPTRAGVAALVRTEKQILNAGGPSDCAKQTVGHVFGNSEGTMGQRIRRPTRLPAGITFFAFAHFSNLLTVTEYVLRTVGWTETEAIGLVALARKLYAKRPRSDRAFFFAPPTA